jgi:F0F1-type ATP synthase membrane subunit b/b'
MDNQIFFIILIGFGVLAIILFGLDIYYLARKPKEEKGVLSLKFSEKFLPELEKIINQEMKRAISEINQKVTNETMESYKKQMATFSQEAENKMAGWDEITKKEILKFSNTCSRAEDLILQEAKSKTNELSKGLDEKIDRICQLATESINQKIAKTENNIEDYKKEKLKEIDQKIYQIIGEVAKKIIGRAIDLSTHEKLVIETLQKAKKEGIF